MTRLYSPALVLVFWAVVIAFADIGRGIAAFALLTLAVSIGLHSRETHRRRL